MLPKVLDRAERQVMSFGHRTVCPTRIGPERCLRTCWPSRDRWRSVWVAISAGVGAPSSLAGSPAREHGLTVLAFVRPDR